MSKVRLAEKIRNLGEALLPGEGGGFRVVPQLCVLYPVLSRTTEEKLREKYLIQCSQNVSAEHDSLCRNDRLFSSRKGITVDPVSPWDILGNMHQHLVSIGIC